MPDTVGAQFGMKGAQFPGVVLEVTDLQSFELLRSKAENHIINSFGDVQLVIGIEADAKKSMKISTWRPEFTPTKNENMKTVTMKTILDRVIIQDEDGNIIPGSVDIPLRDFGADLAIEYPSALLDKKITLSYHDLARWFAEAEEKEAEMEKAEKKKARKEEVEEEKVEEGEAEKEQNAQQSNERFHQGRGPGPGMGRGLAGSNNPNPKTGRDFEDSRASLS